MIVKYRDWSPTKWDIRGLSLPDRGDWIVAPVICTRDSDAIEESNYESAIKLLDDAGAEYETHAFRHWACGYFEIVLVDPAFASVVGEIQTRLEDHPILDEEDCSRRQFDRAFEAWEEFGHSDFCREMQRLFELSELAVGIIDSAGPDETLHFRDENSSESWGWDANYTPDHYIDRDALAGFIRRLRREAR